MLSSGARVWEKEGKSSDKISLMCEGFRVRIRRTGGEDRVLSYLPDDVSLPPLPSPDQLSCLSFVRLVLPLFWNGTLQLTMLSKPPHDHVLIAET